MTHISRPVTSREYELLLNTERFRGHGPFSISPATPATTTCRSRPPTGDSSLLRPWAAGMGAAVSCIATRSGEHDDEVEALILLTEGAHSARGGGGGMAAAAVGGRIVAGFLPHALIVQATEEAIDDLRQSLGAATVYTDAVPATAVERAPEPLRSVLTAWNQRRSLPGVRPEPRGPGWRGTHRGFCHPIPHPRFANCCGGANNNTMRQTTVQARRLDFRGCFPQGGSLWHRVKSEGCRKRSCNSGGKALRA